MRRPWSRSFPEIAAVLLASLPVGAQLRVTSVTPRGHANAAPTATKLAMTFDQALNPATVTPASFQVFGRWSGPLPGTLALANGNRELVFTPSRPLFPGELVFAMASAAIAAQAGPNLVGGYSWSFWIGTARGSGQLAHTQTLNVRRPNEGRIASYGAYSGDFDHDGAPDFAIPNEFADDVRVLRSDGCATYSAPVRYALPAGSVPSPNEGGDFNRDGHIDLAVGNTQGSSISILLGDGLGGFLPARSYAAGSQPRGIAVLDLEGDGDHDVVAANRVSSNLALYRNQGDGTFAPAVFFEGGGTGETALAAADLDNNGWMDLLVGHFNSNNVTALLNNGAGVFTAGQTTSCGGSPWQIAAGDWNGDGNCDVMSANFNNGTAGILFGNGAGGLGSLVTVPVGAQPLSIDAGDLEGDGDLDLVASSYTTSVYAFYRNNGAGSFGGRTNITVGAAGSCVLWVDFDRDGDLDFVAVDEVDDKLYLYAQVGPAPGGVQAPSCAAAMRIDELADRGGYGAQATHRAPRGGRFFLGVSGAPSAPFAVVGGVKREPGLGTTFGLLNLDPAQLVQLAVASLDANGEARFTVQVPLGTPVGIGVGFQAAVLDPVQGLVLTNPEEVAAY
jgi:hypothetical protein